MGTSEIWEKRKKRIFEIIEIGAMGDTVSRLYDLVGAFAIVINLTVSVLYTFAVIRERVGAVLLIIESFTVLFFAVDYALRFWTARFQRPDMSEGRARWKYFTSFTGIVDLLSFLPYYLPVFFPSGAVAFRMFRVVRIFRLFRINAYYDSLNVITEVIASKSQQLISSVFIILVLMLAASLCMYSLEHEAQPAVFTNAFSGIWWSASTLLTVGYGDIYPITNIGRLFSICITFLGVGMVAIPTGIISAGFVEQYSHIKQISEQGQEDSINFIKVHLMHGDPWVGSSIADLNLPHGIIVAVIQREQHIVVPRGNVILLENDIVVCGAETYENDQRINLKEIELLRQHPWNGEAIRDLDISRQTIIVMVKRNGKVLIPKGDLILREGDKVILYTQRHMSDANTIPV